MVSCEIEMKIKDSAKLFVHSSIDKAMKVSVGYMAYADWLDESACAITME